MLQFSEKLMHSEPPPTGVTTCNLVWSASHLVRTEQVFYGKSIRGGVQQLSGAGAVDLDNLITELTTTGANALTLL